MKKITSIFSVLMLAGFLSGCNNVDDDRFGTNQVDDRGNRINDDDREIELFENRKEVMDRYDVRDIEPLDVDPNRTITPTPDYENGEDEDFELNQNNVRSRNEVDTPLNMDEEEPDLDEEPSEEIRD